jgi:hypothetical protein
VGVDALSVFLYPPPDHFSFNQKTWPSYTHPTTVGRSRAEEAAQTEVREQHVPSRAMERQRGLSVLVRSKGAVKDTGRTDLWRSIRGKEVPREPFCIQKKTCLLEMTRANHFDTPSSKPSRKIKGIRCIPAGTVFVTRQEHRVSIKTISEGWSHQ